jgi:hypothetical protein
MSRFVKKLYGSAFVNKFVAEITGKHTHYRPYAWVDCESQYSHITGGMILPTFDRPGYLLTVGVRYDESDKIDCLDEFQADDEYEIIERALDVQDEYGPGVISTWWGDPKDLMSLIGDLSTDKNRVIVSAPIDSNQPDAFQIYTARLRVSLAQGHKALIIGGCNLLRNHVLAFVREKQAKPDNSPAIYVAGSLVHTLLTSRPWEQAYETQDLIPTTHEDYAAYEHGQELKRLEGEVWG